MPNASPRYSPVGSKPSVKLKEPCHSTRYVPPAAAFLVAAFSGLAVAVVVIASAASAATAATIAILSFTWWFLLGGFFGGPRASAVPAPGLLDVRRADS